MIIASRMVADARLTASRDMAPALPDLKSPAIVLSCCAHPLFMGRYSPTYGAYSAGFLIPDKLADDGRSGRLFTFARGDFAPVDGDRAGPEDIGPAIAAGHVLAGHVAHAGAPEATGA